MTLKRIILIGLFLFIADLFIACCRCDEMPIIEFKRCELVVSNLKYTDTEHVELTTDSINKEEYGIQLWFVRKENTCQVKSTGLFINSALACSCDGQQGKALDRFESMRVFTLQPFDSIHPAESDITEYFIGEPYNPMSIPDYIASQNTDNGYTYYRYPDFMSIKLIATPDSVISRQFNVEVTMTDGRVLSQLTQPVVLY